MTPHDEGFKNDVALCFKQHREQRERIAQLEAALATAQAERDEARHQASELSTAKQEVINALEAERDALLRGVGKMLHIVPVTVEDVVASVTEVQRKSDEIQAERDALQKSLDSWIAWARSSRCIYCDQEFIHDPHDQASADADKKAHILVCAKHPLAEARRVLRTVQWARIGGCPLCHFPQTHGHAPACALAAVLAQEGK